MKHFSLLLFYVSWYVAGRSAWQRPRFIFPERRGEFSFSIFAISVSKNKTVVQILNPLPGGSNYTSPRRALRFIKIGRAEPVGRFAIRFTHRLEVAMQIDAERRLLDRRAESRLIGKQPWRAVDDDRLIDERMEHSLPWNGCDLREKAYHIPFTASVFRKALLRIPVKNEMRP